MANTVSNEITSLHDELERIKLKLPEQNNLLTDEQIKTFDAAMWEGIKIENTLMDAFRATHEAKVLAKYNTLSREEKLQIDLREKKSDAVEALSKAFKTVKDYVEKYGTITGYPYGPDFK